MIEQFWMYFLGTGVVMRLLVPPLHFKNKTPTNFIRRKIQKNSSHMEIHHFHFGLLFAVAALLLIAIHGLNKPILLFGAMGLSFIADELFIVKDFSEYFTKKGLYLSVLGHVLIGVIITLLLVWVY
jgi:hypothetical protein